MSKFLEHINSLRNKVMQHRATPKEKAIVEYYDKTRGGVQSHRQYQEFFGQPYNYARMKEWIQHKTSGPEVIGGQSGRFPFAINSLRDKVVRGTATVKEKAIVEYYERTRGGIQYYDKSHGGSWYYSSPYNNDTSESWARGFFNQPYNYARMNDWIRYRQAEAEYEAVARKEVRASPLYGAVGDRYMAAVHDKGYQGSFAQWYKENIKDLNREAYNNTNYDPNPGINYFQPRKAQTPDEVYAQAQVVNKHGGAHTIKFGGPREFTTLDIETDDFGRPITISALKNVYNTNTGKFEIVDSFQRFYQSKDKYLIKSGQTHRLNAKLLNKLRDQQHAEYSKTYGDAEADALKEFLGSSIIVGHNIVDFDLPHLFKEHIHNQTIDTLIASRNQWEGKKNDLDTVFKRLFGKTMEQAGLSHHDSMSDVIAEALVAQAMMKLKGETGRAIRYVATHPGTHVAPLDEYLESQVVRGDYDYIRHLGLKGKLEEEKGYTDQLVERYVEMKDDDIKELMDAKQQFETKYDEVSGKAKIPEGFSATDLSSIDREGVGNDLIDTINLYTTSMAEVAKQIKGISQDTGIWAQEMKDIASLRNFSEMRSFRIRAAGISDPEARMKFIQGAGYKGRVAEEVFNDTKDVAEVLEEQKVKKREQSVQATWNDRIEKAIWEAEYRGDEASMATLRKAWDKGPKTAWKTLRDVDENVRKERAISSALKHGKISEGQAASLRTEAAAESFDDLSDSLDGVIEKNQKLYGVFRALNSIPMYNFERLEHTFKGEVSGIVGAAKGIMPDFVYSPFSRLTSANMNSFTEQIADLKYGVRAGSTIGNGLLAAGGTLMFTGVGGPAGAIMAGVGGTINMGTQLFGNYKEAQVTKWGEGIQNNLNSIGFVQDMILMPFRLLKLAIDKVIKGLHLFGSVLKAITNIVSAGLGSLTQMGNPLSDFTGLGYGGYMGSSSADYASLLGKGTISGIMNDMAIQRTNMYAGYGINTNRMTAAARLGVFNNFYGDVYDEEEMFEDAINRLHARLQKESKKDRKTTYGLINQLSPQMGSILQTMETLGIHSYSALKRPAGMWGYSEAAMDGYRSRFQQAQWEYQYAGMQKETTMQRLGTTLWNGSAGTFGISGRGLYNEFNKLFSVVADAAESGDWGKVGAQLKDLWTTITTGADGAWKAVKDAFGIDSSLSFGDWVKKGLAGIGIAILKGLRDYVIPVVYNVWDQIADIAIDKLTGIIEYLSTIRIDWGEFKKQVIDGKKSNVPWITSVGTNPGAYDAPIANRSYSNLRKLGPYDEVFGAAYDATNNMSNGYRNVGFGVAINTRNKEAIELNDQTMAYTIPKHLQKLLLSGAFEGIGSWSQYKPAGVKGTTPLDTPLEGTLRGLWKALYNNPERISVLNKYLSEELGADADIDVSSIFPNKEKGISTDDAIRNWTNLMNMLSISDEYNAHQLEYSSKYSGFFKTSLDPRKSRKNQILHNVNDSVKGIRGDVTTGTMNSFINAMQEYYDSIPSANGNAAKVDMTIHDENKNKLGEINYDGGKIKASSYNGYVQLEARDGLYQFQSNQSNRVAGR